MPPWSNRLLSPNSRNEPGPDQVPAHSSSHSPARSRSRITESDILENAYGIPTLPLQSHSTYGTSSSSSKPARTPSHGRSMSHPFPSLFTGKKKRDGDSGAIGGFDSTDSDTVSPVKSYGVTHKAAAKQKAPDKDLRTGKCMTCDSMVRWPKELKVFRCTVCVTINDLKPITLEARRGDGQRVPVAVKAGTYPGPSFQAKGMYSIEAITGPEV